MNKMTNEKEQQVNYQQRKSKCDKKAKREYRVYKKGGKARTKKL